MFQTEQHVFPENIIFKSSVNIKVKNKTKQKETDFFFNVKYSQSLPLFIVFISTNIEFQVKISPGHTLLTPDSQKIHCYEIDIQLKIYAGICTYDFQTIHPQHEENHPVNIIPQFFIFLNISVCVVKMFLLQKGLLKVVLNRYTKIY